MLRNLSQNSKKHTKLSEKNKEKGSRSKGDNKGDNLDAFYEEIFLSGKNTSKNRNDDDDDDDDVDKIFDSKGVIKRKYVKNAGGASAIASAMIDHSPPLTSPENIAKVLGDLSPKKDQAEFIEKMMLELPADDLEPMLPLFMGQLLMHNAGGDVSSSDLKKILKKVNDSDNKDVVLDYLNENLEDEADSLTDGKSSQRNIKTKIRSTNRYYG